MKLLIFSIFLGLFISNASSKLNKLCFKLSSDNNSNDSLFTVDRVCAIPLNDKPSISVKDDYIPFEVTITNHGNDVLPNDTIISFQESSLTNRASFHLGQNLNPLQTITIQCNVGIKDGSFISNVPSFMNITMISSNRESLKLRNSIVNMRSEAFAGSLLQYPNEMHNIVLFGPARSGKSTTNNNFAISLSEVNDPPFRTGSGDEHVTLTFSKYELKNVKNVVMKVNINLFETFGFEKETYKDKEVEWILDGRMKLGVDYKGAPNGRLDKPKEENRIDAVALLLSIEFTEKGHYLEEKLKKVLDLFNHKGYTPIIVLTHAQNLSYDERKDAIDKISSIYGVGKSNIVITSCYENESDDVNKQKDFDVDIKALALLERLVLESHTKKVRDGRIKTTRFLLSFIKIDVNSIFGIFLTGVIMIIISSIMFICSIRKKNNNNIVVVENVSDEEDDKIDDDKKSD